MALSSFEGTASHTRSHSDPLNPTAAAPAVAREFALQARCDPQIGSFPETIHLTGEVGSCVCNCLFYLRQLESRAIVLAATLIPL